jgi:hypothetical protein
MCWVIVRVRSHQAPHAQGGVGAGAGGVFWAHQMGWSGVPPKDAWHRPGHM